MSFSQLREEEKHEKCMGSLEEALNKNETVTTLLDSITALGCEIPKDFFSCIKCDNKNISGGFVQPGPNSLETFKPKLIMNESVDMNKKVFETTLIHELIHAYDICRVKTNSLNCNHNACMEIRASSLRFVL